MTRDQQALQTLVNQLHGPVEVGLYECAIVSDNPEVIQLYLDLKRILIRARFQLARLQAQQDLPGRA